MKQEPKDLQEAYERLLHQRPMHWGDEIYLDTVGRLTEEFRSSGCGDILLAHIAFDHGKELHPGDLLFFRFNLDGPSRTGFVEVVRVESCRVVLTRSIRSVSAVAPNDYIVRYRAGAHTESRLRRIELALGLSPWRGMGSVW